MCLWTSVRLTLSQVSCKRQRAANGTEDAMLNSEQLTRDTKVSRLSAAPNC